MMQDDQERGDEPDPIEAGEPLSSGVSRGRDVGESDTHPYYRTRVEARRAEAVIEIGR